MIDVIDKIKRFEEKEYIEEDLTVLTKVNYSDFLHYVLNTYKNIVPVHEITKTEEDYYNKCDFIISTSFYRLEDFYLLNLRMPVKLINHNHYIDCINNERFDSKIKPLFRLSEDFRVKVDMKNEIDYSKIFNLPEKLVLYSPYRNILSKTNFALATENEDILSQEELNKIILDYLSNKNVKKLTK